MVLNEISSDFTESIPSRFNLFSIIFSNESSEIYAGNYGGFFSETFSERSLQTSSAGSIVGIIGFEGKRRMGAIS